MRYKAVLTMLAILAVGVSGTPKTHFIPAPGSPQRVGSQPNDIAAGDVNGDGQLDLITANAGSNDISVLLGDGNGGFRSAPGSPFPAGPAPHLLALGDLTGDSKLDVAVTSHDSNDVLVLQGDGRGGFRPAVGSPFSALRTPNPHNHGLALGDINGDGRLDITTANQNDNSIAVLLNDGAGGFTPGPGSPFGVGRSPYPHALGDVDGDGSLDLLAPNVGSNSVSVLLGNGKGGFAAAPGSPLAVLTRPYFAALADVNTDVKLDLILAHDDTSRMTVLLGDGQGRFRAAPGSPFDAGGRGWKVRTGDVNGDGKTDLVTGALGNRVLVLLGNGKGGFSPAPGSPLAVGRGPWAAVLADLNGDGGPDIITANQEDGTVTILLTQS